VANYDPAAALAEILAPTNARAQPLSELGFHQGQVIDWNSTTGENTILLGGSEIVDVPMLNIGDTVNINAGDTVAVFRYRNAYFIIGRVIVPNTEVFATSAVSFYANSDTSTGYALTTTEEIRATVTISIPSWANRALIIANVVCTGVNSTGANDAIFAAVWIDSFNGPQTVNSVAPGLTGSATSGYYTQAVTIPGGSFDVTGRTRTNTAGWAANALNRTLLNVAVTFTRIPDA
jgi:hypothetical protein